MAGGDGFLVVGGDSLVGGGVVAALARRGHHHLATTRRETIAPGRCHLDFESETPFRAPDNISHAFIIAAATNYDRCENDPLAYRINVEFIPRTVTQLLEQGVFVTFISTNSVFGGERPWPNEDDPHEPGIAYARQKSQGEEAIRMAAERIGAQDCFSVVRLTKILYPDVSPLPAWFSAWERGEVVQPFADLVFAPMSVRFVGEALATLGEKRISGNLHLSGAQNVTYVELAEVFAAKMNIDPGLISQTTAVEKGINILFKPRYSGLGMDRTTRLSGLHPQPIADVVEDVLAARGN